MHRYIDECFQRNNWLFLGKQGVQHRQSKDEDAQVLDCDIDFAIFGGARHRDRETPVRNCTH